MLIDISFDDLEGSKRMSAVFHFSLIDQVNNPEAFVDCFGISSSRKQKPFLLLLIRLKINDEDLSPVTHCSR